MKNITPIILCGGTGARLWPMSRDMKPKQFQPVDGVGTQTFFQRTVLRHVAPGFAAPVVVSGARYQGEVRGQLAEIGKSANILLEPMARGTGPAVLAAALLAARKDPKSLLLVAPSDHLINGDLCAAVRGAADAALSGHIVVFGIAPRYPETGYGYIQDAGPVSGQSGLRKCGGFVEKPSHYKAAQLLASKAAYWASGLSLFTAETLINEFRKFAPETLDAVKAALTAEVDGLMSGVSYAQAQSGATETLIFERSARMLLAPLDLEWDDVGSWSAMHAIGMQDGEGNLLQGDVLSVDTQNSMVRSDGKLVAVVGMSDLILVDTPDALLVTRRGRCQDVRQVVEALKQARRSEGHRFTHDRAAVPATGQPWRQNLKLSQAGDVDMSLMRIPGGSGVHLSGQPERQLIVLSGRLSASQDGQSRWLRARDQLVLTQGDTAHLENPDDTEVEALMLCHRSCARAASKVQQVSYAS